MLPIYAKIYVTCLLLWISRCTASDGNDGSIILVVMEESGTTPLDTFSTYGSILEQIRNVPAAQKPSVLHVPGNLTVKGDWTILPLVKKIGEGHENCSWIVLVQGNTEVDWNAMRRLLKSYDSRKNWFLGHALRDEDATIVHHFAFYEDPSQFQYPFFDAGFALSCPLVKQLTKRLREDDFPADFAIDAQHELAMYVWNKGKGETLTHSGLFCLEPGDSCATWIRPFQTCGPAGTSRERMFFAVKTCRQFHEERVPVVLRTWAPHARHIRFYSDVQDASIPTVSLGIPNTERGHCAKTMSIIQQFAAAASAGPHYADSIEWLIIADDDTILSVPKLEKLLSCYDASEPVLLGQRYGYASARNYGYDYITGGGSMVLSAAAARLVSATDACNCPQADTPDDMWLGACAQGLGIQLRHFAGFHQARPLDYPQTLLDRQFVVSFHKHWMLDPIQVYSDWFGEGKGDDHVTVLDQKAAIYQVPSDLADNAKRDFMTLHQSRDEL